MIYLRNNDLSLFLLLKNLEISKMQPLVDKFQRPVGRKRAVILLVFSHKKYYNVNRTEELMKLGEKILFNRKKMGMSQEDLAEKLGVSRQSVSKWEVGAAAPDVDKLVKLSEIFGITLDELVIDSVQTNSDVGAPEEPKRQPQKDSTLKTVTIGEEELIDYFNNLKRAGTYGSISQFMFIISPTILILLGGLVSNNMGNISENVAGAIGTVVLLILVIIGVLTKNQSKESRNIINEYSKVHIEMDLKSKNLLDNLNKKLYTRSRHFKNVGKALCFLCVVPMILFSLIPLGQIKYNYGLVCLLIIVGLGSSFLTISKITDGSLDIINEQGAFSRDKKSYEFVRENTEGKRKFADKSVVTGYRILEITVYLAVSFITLRWDITWLIFLAGEGILLILKKL